MSRGRRVILQSTLWYALYSVVGGLSKTALVDPPLVYSLIAGPSVALGMSHGAEFFLYATLICLPCLWGVVLARSSVPRGLLAAVFCLVWGGFGLFMR